MPIVLARWIAIAAAALALSVGPQALAQEVIALAGDTAPDTGGGTFSFFLAPTVNDSGDVAFQASVSSQSIFSGIFVAPGGGAPTAAVLEGDAVPGGGIFTIFSRPSINASGDIAFIATVAGGSFGSGVFLWSQGQVTALATTQDAVPVAGGFFGTFVGNPWLNDSGEVAFRANITSGSSGLGIFVATTTTISTEFLLGTADPSTTGTFANFGDPSINGDGDILVSALIAAFKGGGGLSAIVGTGMGSPTTFVLQGNAAPDTGGGTYDDLFNTSAPVIASGGRSAFRATVSGGSANNGVFLINAGPSNGALVLDSDALPDTGGGSLSVVNSAGLGLSSPTEVIYAASVSNGTTSAGIFATDDAMNTRTIATQGGAAPAPAGGTYSNLSFAPSISPAGEIAFFSLLSGASGASGIFAVPAPEPAGGASIAVATLALLRRAGRRRRAHTRV